MKEMGKVLLAGIGVLLTGTSALRGQSIPELPEKAPLSTAVSVERAGADAKWSAMGDGVAGTVVCTAACGGQLYVAGSFTAAGGAAHHVASWNGSAWQAMGTGLDQEAYAVVTDGTQVFVGGMFDSAGGIPAHHVACWDVATGTWSALGTGTNDYVWGLALVGRDLFVVGKFTLAGGTVANRVARWNRDEGAWHALGTGLNGEAYTVASTGDDVFVGGAFSEAGGVPASHIARWRPSFSVWTSLGSGTNGVVASLGVRQESIGVIQYHMVYAGGNFTQAGGASASNVAVWNGFSGTWSPLGAGVDGRVRGIRLVDKRVYAGGVFDTAGGVPASRIACWDGSSWLPLGSGTNGYVFSMDAAAYSLFVVGSMSEAGGHAVTGIARWIMPYLFLTSPNGGELWRRGETRPITWSAVGITQPLTIELRRDGVTLGVIASGLDSVAGSFDWTVGRLESGDWVTGDGLGILVRTGSGEALAETTLGK